MIETKDKAGFPKGTLAVYEIPNLWRMGIMANSFFSSTFWLSFIPLVPEYSLAQIKDGRKMFHQFMAERPYTRFAAEIERGLTKNEKFVKFLGAKFVTEIEERDIYMWGN